MVTIMNSYKVIHVENQSSNYHFVEMLCQLSDVKTSITFTLHICGTSSTETVFCVSHTAKKQ